MKTKTKALALALCAVLLVVGTVFATMAYLTATDTVVNTFTVGKVSITLDEAKVNEYGAEISSEARVKENTYKLIPGHEYVKDPTVHVAEGSENCLLFVELKNGLKDIIDGSSSFSEEDTIYTIEAQMLKNGWTCINETNNIWVYKEVVAAKADVPVFENFKLNNDANVSNYATIKDSENNVINVTAYAVQADGFVANTNAGTKVSEEEADDAWAAFNKQ